MAEKILLESPVFNLEAAFQAEKYGVDRIELCSSFTEGGLTPGPGLLAYLKSKIEIPLFVMIRPRAGNFVYSEEEVEVMQEEVRIFSSLGADGFVFGVLNKDGSVNKKACEKLLTSAGEKSCTFHRAFDVTSNLMKSLEDVIECGFQRILTSGGKGNVRNGLFELKKILEKAGDRIIIMPGGGMSPELIHTLKQTGYLKEVHASCKKIVKKPGVHQNTDVHFSAPYLDFDEHLTIDQKKVKEFRSIL